MTTQGEAQPPGPSWTFWVAGPRRRARLVLRGSFFVVGRLEPFAVFQDDPMISRDHAAIVAVEGGVRLRDLGSRNGVLLDGKRLERYAEVELLPGAVVHVGQTSIRLLREGEAPEAPAERRPEDDVTVDEEGQTKGRLAAVVADAAALTSSSDDVGEATGVLEVPDAAEPADEAEVEAVAAAVRDAARTAADEDGLRVDTPEPVAEEAPPLADPGGDAPDDVLEEVPEEVPDEGPDEGRERNLE